MATITARFEQLHSHLGELIDLISAGSSSGQTADSSLEAALEDALETLESLQSRTLTSSQSVVDWNSTTSQEQYAVGKAINVIEGKLQELDILLHSTTTNAIQLGFAVQAVADKFLDIDRVIAVDIVQKGPE